MTAVTVPTNCTDSVGTSYLSFQFGIAPTSSWTATISKTHSSTTTSIGTIAVSGGGTTGTFTCTQTSLASGDWITVAAPVTPDSTASGATISLYWER